MVQPKEKRENEWISRAKNRGMVGYLRKKENMID